MSGTIRRTPMTRFALLASGLLAVFFAVPAVGEENASPQKAAPQDTGKTDKDVKEPPPASTPAKGDEGQGAPQTLVKGKVELGGYGGPVVKVGKIMGGAGVFVGGKGGLVINHAFIVGGGGFGLASTFRASTDTPDYSTDLKLGMGYGGASFEWVYPHSKVVHLSLGILLGGGAAGFYHENSNTGPNPARSVFFIAEPEAAMEINAVSWLRIDLGFSWRIVSSFKQGGLSSYDVSGPTGSILLRFGKF